MKKEIITIEDKMHQATDEIQNTYPEINYSIRLKFSDSRHKDGFGISSTDRCSGLLLDLYTFEMLDKGTEPSKTDVPAFCLLQKGDRFSFAIAVDYQKDYCQSAIVVNQIIKKLAK